MRIFFPVIAICLLALITGCSKKDSTNNNITTVVTNNPVGQYSGGAPAIPSGADGAFYAINQQIINGQVTSHAGFAFAWLGNSSTTLPAGIVTASGDTLTTQVSGSNLTYPWYEGFGNAFGNAVLWAVSGSSSVPAFSFTDNTAFPTVSNYNLPATISASQPLTVTYTISNPFDVVVFTLSGSKGVVTQSSTSSSSVTFSVAQVDSATASGDTNVGLQIMPIKTVSAAINGKTYYFVKQYAYKEYTSVQ